MLPEYFLGNKNIYINNKHKEIETIEIIRGIKPRYIYSLPYISCVEHQIFYSLLSISVNKDIDIHIKNNAVNDIIKMIGVKINKKHKEIVLKRFVKMNTFQSAIPKMESEESLFNFNIDSFIEVARMLANSEHTTTDYILNMPYMKAMHLMDLMKLDFLKKEYLHNESQLSSSLSKDEYTTKKAQSIVKIKKRQAILKVVLDTADSGAYKELKRALEEGFIRE